MPPILVLILIALVVGLEARVSAYVDPGTGSLILQAVVGMVFGIMYYFRRWLVALTSVFRRRDVKRNDGR